MIRYRYIMSIAWFAAVMLLVFGCEGQINKAKNRKLDPNKAQTIGQGLDNFKYLESRIWSSKKADDGSEYVEFVGGLKSEEFVTSVLGDLAVAEGRYTRTKKELDVDRAKIEADVNQILAKYVSGCAGMENEAECIQGFLSRNAQKTFSKSAASAGFNDRMNVLAKLDESIQQQNRVVEFVKDSNFELVYRFQFDQNNLFVIGLGGCRLSGAPDRIFEFDDPLKTLIDADENYPTRIYDGCTKLLDRGQ